jgi:CheY-like chemotaxis protein
VEIESDPKKQGSGKTALVVDDNVAIREMVAHAFLSDGFKTCGEAANGREAIVLAKQIKPDVIVLDRSMPVMNGLSAASELRKIFPSTPILLFTLYGSEVSKTAASAAGVNLVLQKTEPLSAVIEKVHQLMGVSLICPV